MIKWQTITAVIAVSALLVVGLVLVFGSEKTASDIRLSEPPADTFRAPLTPEEQQINNPSDTNTMNPTATIKTTHGDIVLELFADQMPITVNNFISLAASGFYDETKFHRVIEGFMIQAGDPESRSDDESRYGTGGPGHTIEDEFVSGELLTNQRGTVAMANTGQPNSGGSQFFINLGDNTGLDFDKPPASSKHPVFGRVVSGLDVVDRIGTTATKERDIPIEPVVIETITISSAS